MSKSTNDNDGGAQHQQCLFNYHDADIYSSDLAILDSPTAWLNDAVLHFQLTRLEQFHQDYTGGHSENLFLDPSVVSFLMHQLNENDYEEYCEELKNLNAVWQLPPSACAGIGRHNSDGITITRRRVFAPISDQFGASNAEFARPGGGNHWSMLLWEIYARFNSKGHHVQLVSNFFHFDSSVGYNKDAAWRVGKKLGKVLMRFEDDGRYDMWMKDDPEVLYIEECAVPQQNNGYDCGLFALGFAEALASSPPKFPYPDGNFATTNLETKKEFHEAAVRAYFDENGGPESYASGLRRRIGDEIRMLASRQNEAEESE
ncbi:hypothetical protein ACHAWU_003360 [Discostella pseudostelligera]|uniref:Ubiquitin-like protease family profile domain-containing protein n=1 Tax=Discostella pseudostelligera TaxID=259834 RepID=A0ABD3MIN7_9STRA